MAQKIHGEIPFWKTLTFPTEQFIVVSEKNVALKILFFSPNQKQTKNRFFNGATERYIVSRFALD